MAALENDIMELIEMHNDKPKPIKWTKSADEILNSVKRFCLRVDETLLNELKSQYTNVFLYFHPCRIKHPTIDHPAGIPHC